MTKIRLLGEKRIIPPPTPYKHTSIGKKQVTIIRLLQILQRKYAREQDPTPTIDSLRKNEIIYDLLPSSLSAHISEERLQLRKIQQNINQYR